MSHIEKYLSPTHAIFEVCKNEKFFSHFLWDCDSRLTFLQIDFNADKMKIVGFFFFLVYKQFILIVAYVIKKCTIVGKFQNLGLYEFDPYPWWCIFP